jgi:two-component system cell cycle response regulator
MTATILIVDDLLPNIKLLEAKLLSEYYTVYSSNSGQGAIDILKERKIDVILLDGMMPGMDGFEACRLIKANPETTHIPVVMVTALSDIEDRVKGLEAGADEFLTKPVNDVALFARVKSLSRTKAVIDELKLRNQTSAELGGGIMEFVDDFSAAKIMIIDDDVVQAKNIHRMLSKLTPNIMIVSKIDNMDSQIQSFMPEMLIVSCQLESVDPLRVVAATRGIEGFASAPIMLLADEEKMSVVIRGLELGVNDYFLYPVDENELIARAKTQLRRKKYQDALRVQIEEGVNLSIKDGLTGAFNRRYFDLHIKQIAEKARQSKNSFCLAMIDLDHFKEVNDQYGHQAGDEVLKKTTVVLMEKLRVTDLLARYGGEEFVVILSDVDIERALVVAERMRLGVAAVEFNITGDRLIHKTLSMGLVQFNKEESPEQMIARADKALYKAKESGRNKIVVG